MRTAAARTVRVVSTNVIFDEYPLPAGSTILVNDRDHVLKEQIIAMMPAENGNEPVPVMARTEGEVFINADGLLDHSL